jgi:PAS domain S-box-containing protein
MKIQKLPSKYLKELGNRIKHIRAALRYDQKKMSKALDASQSRISKIEVGNASPTLYQLLRLKKVIEDEDYLSQNNDASWGWILEGKSQEPATSEHQWQSFLDKVTLLVLRTDAQGLINYVNSAFLNTTGYSKEELIGEPIPELFPENDRQEVRERIRTSAQGGVRSSVVRPIVAKDGSKIQAKWSNVFLRDGEKRTTGMLFIGEDTAQLTEAQQDLIDERNRMDTILSALDTGLALINPDMTIAWLNQKTIEALDSVDPIGSKCYAIAENRNTPCDDCGCIAAFNDGQSHETERLNSNNNRWYHIVSQPIKDQNGKVVSVLESNTDITERKRVEQAKDHAMKEVEDLKNRLEEENIYLKLEMRAARLTSNIIGSSNAIEYVMIRVQEVAKTDASVLVEGETGTGKELVSQAIHENSRRHGKSFVKVNCAALPANLIESELFGHERGAFTGADKPRIGRFEMADGGTLFLDEISELHLDLQPKLLRVLEDGSFERVGGSKTMKVDVRVIAATNRDLRQEVKQGRFRPDLFYRLNVYPISVPSLKKRRDDIPLLVDHFIPQLAARIGKHIDQISPWSMEQLVDYDWPGNVRELKNVLERAVITSSGSVLRLPAALITEMKNGSPKVSGYEDGLAPLVSVEKAHILKILEFTGWRIDGSSGAAKILDVNPSTLRSRMKKLEIKRV